MNAKPITRRSVLPGIAAFPISMILGKLKIKGHQPAETINPVAQSDSLLGPPVAELSMRFFWGLLALNGEWVVNMVWSPDSGTIAAAVTARWRDIYIWSVKDQRSIGRVLQALGSALTFSPNGNVLVASVAPHDDDENAATLIDSHTAEVIGHIPAPGIPPKNWGLDTAITDPKGRWVALFFSHWADESRGEFHLYEPIEWKAIRSWGLGERAVKGGPPTIPAPDRTITVNPEGTTIAVARNYMGPNQFNKAARFTDLTPTIQQWDVKTGQLKLEFDVSQPTNHRPVIRALAYSQDGAEILTGFTNTLDKRLLVWNASNGQYEREIQIQFPANSRPAINAVAVNPNIAIAAASFSDHRLGEPFPEHRLSLFDFNSGTVITELNLRFGCRCLRFSPDGKFLAYSDGATIFVRPINFV